MFGIGLSVIVLWKSGSSKSKVDDFLQEPARIKKEQPFGCSFVRLIGLEPTRRKTPDPKSGASTNFATGACVRDACL